MEERIMTEGLLEEYRMRLYEEEKAEQTVKKYVRDARKLMEYAGGREITKSLVVEYKEHLRSEGRFKLRSINTFLVAANRFFDFMSWGGLRMKTYRVQRETFAPEGRDLTKGEYRRLVEAAMRTGRKRLAMILQAVCGTGIRIGELSGLTVEGVRAGVAEIYGKGRGRKVLMPKRLRRKLLAYIAEAGIKSGPVFRTSGGRAVDRSNVWREMKALAAEAGVERGKVFPHNLRHLFARTFYGECGDMARLADVLGHGSMETTRIYVMTTGEEHRRRLDAMRLVV